MHWPFGANRHGWRAGWDSLQSDSLVNWRVVGRLIAIWGVVLTVVVIAVPTLVAD